MPTVIGQAIDNLTRLRARADDMSHASDAGTLDGQRKVAEAHRVAAQAERALLRELYAVRRQGEFAIDQLVKQAEEHEQRARAIRTEVNHRREQRRELHADADRARKLLNIPEDE